MAIPDRRTCFDHLRPTSTLGQMLDAYRQRRESPSPAQVFDHRCAEAELVLPNGQISRHFPLDGLQSTVRFAGEPAAAFALMQGLNDGTVEGYQDAHCWVFSPAEFALLIAELRMLGLTGLELAKPITAEGIEFFVTLCKPLEGLARPAVSPAHRQLCLDALIAERRDMQQRAVAELVEFQLAQHRSKNCMPAWLNSLRPMVPRMLRAPLRRAAMHLGLAV